MVSAGNITAIVDRLSTEGYITRTADPQDRRVQIIRMTAEGRAYFAKMAAAHEAWIDEMFSGMNVEETRVLLGLLGKVKVSARKALQEEE